MDSHKGFTLIEMAMVIRDGQNRFAFIETGCAVKAGTAARVAGRIMAGDLDLEPDRILVAIDTDFLDGLQISGAFALLPDLAPRPAEIVADAGLERECDGLCIQKKKGKEWYCNDWRDHSFWQSASGRRN